MNSAVIERRLAWSLKRCTRRQAGEALVRAIGCDVSRDSRKHWFIERSNASPWRAATVLQTRIRWVMRPTTTAARNC